MSIRTIFPKLRPSFPSGSSGKSLAKYNTYVITKGGERIDLVLDTGKRTRWTLAVSEGRLTVRVPYNFRTDQVKTFIEDNLEWIHSALERSAERCGLPQTFENGEHIRLLGSDLVITAVDSDRYFSPEIREGKLLVAVCGTAGYEYMVRQVKGFIGELAAAEIRTAMEKCSKLMGLFPKKVTVKDMSASWGRCSSSGNISVNYKVVTYSRTHIEYVCIHELAHLVHMDHSPQFWELVGRFCPDWKKLRDEMRL